MEFDTYQTLAGLTAVYPGKGTQSGLAYTAPALAAEAGEINGKWAKYVRGDGPLDIAAMLKEAGDVQWTLAALVTDLQASLEDVADENLRKLQSRQARGVIKGSGDNR